MNHFYKKFTLLAIITTAPTWAGVVSFFNPNTSFKPSTLYTNFDYLIASDPISLNGMFHDWKGDYHPRSGRNIALQDMRLDIGTTIFKNFYLGYFHRYNVYIETNKDFTDFFYRIKNHIDLDGDKTYQLNLEIAGIKQSGLVLARNQLLYENSTNSLKLGGSLALTVGHEMQNGLINGEAKILNKKSYHISGEISSNYTHNYLYDLEVNDAKAYGYGSDIALTYSNKKYDIEANFIVNDLFSKMYWKDLPYSQVHIETNNKEYDEDGYVHYNPSFSGVENYKDFTQEIEPRYRGTVKKNLNKEFALLVGLDYVYENYFPYIQVDKKLSSYSNIEFLYENKFQSFGVNYRYKNFKFGATLDELNNASVIGMRVAYNYSF